MDSSEGVWLKVPEAAEYFAVARTRMYDLIQSGELPAVWISERSIRVNRVEVERFLTEHRRVHKVPLEPKGNAGSACSHRAPATR